MSRSAVKIRDAEWLDIILLAPRLRQADVDECEALFGKGSVGRATANTFTHSVMRKTAEVDGIPVAVFGVAAESLLSEVGHPWMFGTPSMEAHSRALIKDGRRYIADMLAMFPRLSNIVDARNKKSIRWLRKMGFKILDPIPVNGHPFHPFEMEI